MYEYFDKYVIRDGTKGISVEELHRLYVDVDRFKHSDVNISSTAWISRFLKDCQFI